MALARDDSIQHPDFRSAGEQRESPGPLHVSDLTSPRRPHKLEPLQQQQGGSGEGGGGGATKTKRKKTRIKRQGAVGELRGDLDGREEASEDPLLDASTLQQMQARLDPLYNPPTNGINEYSSIPLLICCLCQPICTHFLLPKLAVLCLPVSTSKDLSRWR